MAVIGPDFRAGLREALYRPFNPAGLAEAVGFFFVLVIGNQMLQGIFGFGGIALTASALNDETALIRFLLLSVLPAGLLTGLLAWILARRRGADPRDVLALRFPALGGLGWAIVVGGFLIALYVLFGALSWLFGIDITSSGLVEQAVMQLAGDPLYLLIAGGLIIGAPIAEELTFRGQIFAALSQTRLGTSGAAALTSALWAGIHITQPFHIIALLFLMGLALCWLLVRFGSLWVTIVCHAVWNAMSAVALYSMAQP
ncbi:MAG: lysostaphin resistance A-like protein [Parvibaculaceae bacterium]